MQNIEGYRFLTTLREELIPNQLLGNKYTFLKFRINESQRKSIPAEILMIAYHVHRRNNRITNPVLINQQWICANGHSDWCFVEVIIHLLENYN